MPPKRKHQPDVDSISSPSSANANAANSNSLASTSSNTDIFRRRIIKVVLEGTTIVKRIAFVPVHHDIAVPQKRRLTVGKSETTKQQQVSTADLPIAGASTNAVNKVNRMGYDLAPIASSSSVTAVRPEENAYISNVGPPQGTFMNLSNGIENEADQCAFPYRGPLLQNLVPKLQFPVLIPSYSKWFSFDTISDVEKRGLPEFFERHSSRFATVYKDIRDAIVKAYRENPRVYLTITACRRQIAQDAAAIARIHHFLEEWGLINYHTDPGTEPLMSHTSREKSIYPVITHHPFGTSRSTIKQKDKDSQSGNATDINNNITSNGAPTLQTEAEMLLSSPELISLLNLNVHKTGDYQLRRHLFAGAVSAQNQQALEALYKRSPYNLPKCSVCNQNCGILRFVLRQRHDYICCENCYNEGKYDSLMVATDFEKVEKNDDGMVASEWTTEETLKLLDALKAFGDDWDKISDAVETRSKDECVLRFISMPIEDPFLQQYYNMLGTDKATTPNVSDTTSTESQAVTLSKEVATPISTAIASTIKKPELNPASLPFADVANPLMAQIAFLSSSISPSVAAAAARAALVYFAKMSMKKYEDPVIHKMDVSSDHHVVEAGPKKSEATTELHSTVEGSKAPDAHSNPPNQVKVEKSTAETTSNPTSTESTTKSEDAKLKESETSDTKVPITQPSTEDSNAAKSLPSVNHSEDILKAASNSRIHARDAAIVSAIALEAAALKAKELAAEEERKSLRMIAQVISLQMQKVERKLKHMQDIDRLLIAQKESLDEEYLQLFAQRQKLLSLPKETIASSQQLGTANDTSASANSSSSSQPQVVSSAFPIIPVTQFITTSNLSANNSIGR